MEADHLFGQGLVWLILKVLLKIVLVNFAWIKSKTVTVIIIDLIFIPLQPQISSLTHSVSASRLNISIIVFLHN